MSTESLSLNDTEEQLPTKVMFALGALGGLLPVLASLITVDLAPIIDHASALTPGNYIGYVIRVAVLIVLGGTMAALNREVKQPLALVQLGIAAPALVTAYINGGTPTPSAKTAYESLSIISSAKADQITPGPVRLAGGLFGDIIQQIGPGVGTRLDTLNEANKAADSNGLRKIQGNIQGNFNNAIYPNTAPPGPGPGPSIGSFCTTPKGRFGPGPTNPLGSACSVDTPYGPDFGQVTQ
jgi:hypothetical protein